MRAHLGPSGAAELAGSLPSAFSLQDGIRMPPLNLANPPHPSLNLTLGNMGGFALGAGEEWDIDDIPQGIDGDLL